MMVTAFAVVVLLALVLAYRFTLGDTRRPEMFDAAAGGAAPPPAQIVFMYMNGCGWCERMKPEWDKFVAQNAGALGALGVQAASYERSDPAAAAYSAYVKGYPTVLFVKPGATPIAYDGDRTADALMAFVRQQQQQP
jgi:thiol-disulfide isomerase/thioredoxin